MTIIENKQMPSAQIMEGTRYGQTFEIFIQPNALTGYVKGRNDFEALSAFTGNATLGMETAGGTTQPIEGGLEGTLILLYVDLPDNKHVALSTWGMNFNWNEKEKRIELVQPVSQ